MNKDDRINQLRDILNGDDKPSTYPEVAKAVGVYPSYISQIVSNHDELYGLILRNKRIQRRKAVEKKISIIHDFMQLRDVSAQYACLALGFNPTAHSQLKKELQRL